MNKERIGCVIPVVVLLGLFAWWAYYSNAEKREAREARERERTTEAESREAEKHRLEAESARENESFAQIFKDLAARHNAAHDWCGTGTQRFYTLEWQDAVQKHGDRAILCCRVRDVFKVGDGFRVVGEGLDYVDTALINPQALGVICLLEIDEATARRLVESPNDDASFALAVVVKRVTVTLTPKYSAIGETVEAGTYESDQETEAEIQEGDLFPRLLITGKCLEIVDTGRIWRW